MFPSGLKHGCGPVLLEGDLRMGPEVRIYLLYALRWLAFCGFLFRLGRGEIDGV